ncbi:MAG: BNR-4 repeat-containing protein [Sedimentisphaerales bacterium]|nr:BNR-4 repeat-containing protein [Sedimentisphaerales bacterium]
MTWNRKDTGYRGVWYMNQPLKNEYRFKYSGGMATFCAKHSPFAVYCDKVRKTFFCYGGTMESSHLEHDLTSANDGKDASGVLLHMVSYYDHTTGKVPRPTVILDKGTKDAHDNPVISVDDKGYIWIFSTSHGTSRPSYIHRSRQPYDIDAFEQVHATKIEDGREVAMTNFSYMQPWFVPGQGFVAFFTRYNYPAARTVCFMTSPDGVRWSAWQRLGAIGEGHYGISAANERKAGAALNYHPKGKGLNWRTNLYYMETTDRGQSWHSAGGANLTLPLTEPQNAAIVHDYEKDGLLVYLKDIRFDEANRPVILFITSKGFRSGPQDDPRTWTTARWTGSDWEIRPITTSDNNYDMGSLYIESDGTWRIVGPTEQGPQPYNPGGEMALWTSDDRGAAWKKVRQLTSTSPFNHTFARRPVNTHDDFYAFWADGHGREPSASSLYFCNKTGDVYRLPRTMTQDFATPERLIQN